MTVHRTKLLAAAVLLTGGLASVVGTGYLSEAAAQQPKPKGSDAAAKQADDAAKQLEAAKKALATLQAQADQTDVQRKLLDELLAQPQAKPTETKSASKWEYDFVLASEMATTKFVAFLNDREGRGWEFISEVSLLHDGKEAPHWVFRRPAGGAKAAAASDDYKKVVESYMKQRNALQAEQETLRALEALKAAGQKKTADPAAKPAPADLFNKLDTRRAAEERLRAAKEAARAEADKQTKTADGMKDKEKALEAEIVRLKMEIEKLKVGNVFKLKDLAEKPKPEADNAKRFAEDIKRLIEKEKQAEKAKSSPEKVKPSPEKTKPLGEKIEKKQLLKLVPSKVFSPEEIVELLTSAAQKQFGKDAPVIELNPERGGVLVAGSEKAVDWVVALGVKLTRNEEE